MMKCWQRPRPIILLACLVAVGVTSLGATSANRSRAGWPSVRARAAVVMDAATGAVVYAKSPDERLPPASTTKVMTAALALESRRLDETVTVSGLAASTQPTKVHLEPGDRVGLRDLTYAVLIQSANDASIVVAEALAGSVEDFAARMNRRAAELGARNTRFVNPNGLPAQGHYSTARDLAVIFRYALDVPGFREIAGTAQSRITAWRRKSSRMISLHNHNRLLQGYRVPVIGKTGYTRAAKRCFVGAARAGGREVVVALLGSTDMWGDARRLLDFGLTHSGSVASVNARNTGTIEDRNVGHPSPGPALNPRIGRAHSLAAGRQGEFGYYSLILVPGYNTPGAAERLRHFISRRGHSAVIETIGLDRSRQYRVRVVGLRTLDAALRARAELRAEHLYPTIEPSEVGGSANPSYAGR